MFPLEENLWRKLNYPDILSDEGADELFYKLHQSEWGEACEISKGFVLHKIHQKLQDYQHQGKLIDLVYFDAFGPDVQPELWTPEIFKNKHKMILMETKSGKKYAISPENPKNFVSQLQKHTSSPI